MSKPIDDGGPAFPVPQDAIDSEIGMTLRDYFAAKAMQAAYGSLCDSVASVTGSEERAIAVLSYKLADAMLAARKGGAK